MDEDTQLLPVFVLRYKNPPLTQVTWFAPVSALMAISCQFRGVVMFVFVPSIVMPLLDHDAPKSVDL